MKSVISALSVVLLFSCTKENDNQPIKEQSVSTVTVSNLTAQDEICSYQSSHPNQMRAFYFTWSDLRDIHNQDPSIDGVRIYLGQDATGKFTAYANGCVGANDYVPGGINNLIAPRSS